MLALGGLVVIDLNFFLIRTIEIIKIFEYKIF